MKPDSKYKLRDARREDGDLLFNWANDYEVRLNSFNSNPIKYEEHIRWFDNKLKSSNSSMYVFEVDEIAVGMIRLDLVDGQSHLINYSICKGHRGKGYATELLRLIKELNKASLLIGKVKSTNIGSIKAFIKAGYEMEGDSQTKVFYSSK